MLSGLLLVGLVVAQPLQVSAQQESFGSIQQPTVLRWWHGAIALGGLSALMLLDGSSQRFFQDQRSTQSDDWAGSIRRIGQPEVYGTVTLGLVAAGLVSGDHDLTRAGGRLAATLLLAGGISTVGKLAFGRPRPSESLDADGYSPFSGQDAMPWDTLPWLSRWPLPWRMTSTGPGPPSGCIPLPPASAGHVSTTTDIG
jgi:hypothetical protein